MVAQLVSKANEYFDAQREKSRRGYEKSTRRFRRLGMMPDQIAALCSPKLELSNAPACMSDPKCEDCDSPFHAAGSVACPVGEETPDPIPDLSGSRDLVQSHTGYIPGFIVEFWNHEKWVQVEGPNFRSAVAKDLLGPTQTEAKRNLGTRYRIRRNDGTRAVHRIAARLNKAGTAVEFYKWST